MAKFDTVAEAVAWRALEELPPVDRVSPPTFGRGQHKARLTPSGMAQLTFVDVAGSMIMIILQKRDEEWFLASTHGIRVSHTFMELIPFPRSFQLNEDMLRALTEAEQEVKERRAKRKKPATQK